MRRLIASFVAGLFMTFAPSLAQAQIVIPPTKIVADFCDTLIAAMKQGPTLGFKGRYERLEPAFKKAFSIGDMTRIASGSRWNAFTPEQRDQVVAAFERYSISNYAAQFNEHEGERFEFRGERQQGSNVIVETRLVGPKMEGVPINYMMQFIDGQWRIVDVYLNGTISELATRRSEFSSVIARDGANGLVTVLDNKSADLSKRK